MPSASDGFMLGEILALLPGARVSNLPVGGPQDWSLRPIRRIVHDSRQVEPGDLFVALSPQCLAAHHIPASLDGHAFLPEVAQRGALAALVEVGHPALRSSRVAPLIYIECPPQGEDLLPGVLEALGILAQAWRRRFEIALIAVTGSSGKTTLKTMIAAMLAEVYSGAEYVCATEGNYNNQLGVPLTLLRLQAHHRAGVVEMGMNHSGEIARLSHWAEPTLAIINNAGSAHGENLGSLEAIARAKGEIFAGLTAGGIALLNRDDAHYPLWRQMASVGLVSRRVIDFGLHDGDIHWADSPAPGVQVQDWRTRFTLHTPHGAAAVCLPAPGLHNVRNALAAAAVGYALAIGGEPRFTPESIARGLAAFPGVPGRLQRRPSPYCAMLIDDSYNANPDSMAAALAVLEQLPAPRVAVLGDMRELDHPTEQHRQLLCAAHALPETAVFTFGGALQAVAQETAFLTLNRVFAADEAGRTALQAALREHLDAHPNASVLVKGSRAMAMERIVAALAEPEPKRAA